jgi:hypothetical protein
MLFADVFTMWRDIPLLVGGLAAISTIHRTEGGGEDQGAESDSAEKEQAPMERTWVPAKAFEQPGIPLR